MALSTSAPLAAPLAVCLALSAGPAFVFTGAEARAGVVLEIEPSRDAGLYESATGDLANGSGAFFFTGSTIQPGLRRGLLYFDLASRVPAGSTITAVELQLTMSRGSSALSLVSLHLAQRAWAEGPSIAPGEQGAGAESLPGDSTWIHAQKPGTLWTNPGGDFNPVPSAALPVAGTGVWTFPSTPSLVADAQSWLDQPDLNLGYFVLGDETDPGPTAKRFGTRESPSPADRPILRVTYIPSPGAAGVLALGLTAFGRRRRIR